ncbi:hypothetical protein E4U43_003632 [Claviceps pusilla]|uniref:JmjC domain-containing protein n=1 Tax=Claviceps pusilla TaxID=123648 RepID=A0A9P7NHE0_9HYPO|nr:hypothetical protein E4U43_003632 [Claviceps pusilla]
MGMLSVVVDVDVDVVDTAAAASAPPPLESGAEVDWTRVAETDQMDGSSAMRAASGGCASNCASDCDCNRDSDSDSQDDLKRDGIADTVRRGGLQGMPPHCSRRAEMTLVNDKDGHEYKSKRAGAEPPPPRLATRPMTAMTATMATTAEEDSCCVAAETLPLSPRHVRIAPAVVEDAQSVSLSTASIAATSTQEDLSLQTLSTQDIPTRDASTQDKTCDSDIKYDYHDVDGHPILRLRPTRQQWQDFPTVLALASRLNVARDGCFKVVIPSGLHGPLPRKPVQHVAANAYKVKLIRRTSFWQVSTVPSQSLFAPSCPDAGADAGADSGAPAASNDPVDSVHTALKNLKHLFRKHQNRQLRNIRYRVDVPAWTKTQRRHAGVPEQSPIYPLKGDKLDHTKAVIPGIHTPYVYESGPYFGATFQIHAEDFRLASLNHLYKGRKIWIVIPATAVDIAEKALGRGSGCSQFMRHRAEFFFPDKLQKLGIPYRIVDQRPGETIVILPDAYHEGFSCGYTIAEAKNYADAAWTTDSYQPCEASCRLATAIPAAFMRPLAPGEQRLDLCATYGDGDEGGPDSRGGALPSSPSLGADAAQNLPNHAPLTTTTTTPLPNSALHSIIPSPTSACSSKKSDSSPCHTPELSQDIPHSSTTHPSPPTTMTATQNANLTHSLPSPSVTSPSKSLPRKREETPGPETDALQTMLPASNTKRIKTTGKAGPQSMHV